MILFYNIENERMFVLGRERVHMTRHDYVLSIYKLLKKMDIKQIKLVFEYAHRIFINGIGS